MKLEEFLGEDGPRQGDTRSGYVAIVGRPNVGKSTLLNHLLGQKISITSRKPQTTRHRILGIKTVDDVQIVYVDTPGIHLSEERAINRFMNKAATSSVRDVDVVVFLVDRDRWTPEDDRVMHYLQGVRCPVILAVNKVDRVEDKDSLLPVLADLSEKRDFAAVVPLSALRKQNLDVLEERIQQYIPKGDHWYGANQVTDRSERFMAAELVREKIMRQLGEELPYAMTVEIESFKTKGKTLHIDALILIERDGQKKIVIGSGGSRLKTIGREARLDMEKAFDQKVMLRLWVKVRAGWSDDERALRSLGYMDPK